MDHFRFLYSEHSRFRDVMQQIEEYAPSGLRVRERLFERLYVPFLQHLRTEQQVLFAVLRDDRECRDSVLKAQEQHNLLDLLLGELMQLPRNNLHWVPKFRVFRELAEYHFECEQNELFLDALEFVSQSRLEMLEERIGAVSGTEDRGREIFRES
ncbi:MAG: hemerythrin domain-containing protein [Chitinispirillaceae bacterium]